MGIPLIHSELPSGLASPQAPGAELQGLLDRRQEVETALDRYAAVLDANGIDLTSPLVTRDGFPRQDVDVANVRIARTAIHRLRNDYKALDRAIELALHEAFERGTPVKLAPRRQQEGDVPRPFCRVASVAANSPAEVAGLVAGDEVAVFGRARVTNHDDLRAMAREVAEAVAEAKPIQVTVLRPGAASSRADAKTTVKIALQPNNAWGGRGAVGAHFLPL